MRTTALLIVAVLIVGACDGSGSSQSAGSPTNASASPARGTAEPQTGAPGAVGSLTDVGSLLVTRASHTATALPDGRILVAGGCTEPSCEGVSATTELLDPATGTSIAGPDMREPRVGHVAVTMADGRILLIGGFGPNTVTRTTDVFDPATGDMTPGPDLTEPRADPVAIVFDDGSLLLAGGNDGRGSVSTAEVLDPGASAFRATGSLSVVRSAHAGSLLSDGRVLVVGGSTGGDSGAVHASAEVYDPATGTWTATGDLSVRRHKHGAIVLADGRVLVVGGSDENDGFGRYQSAELYDPAAGTFTSTVDMAAARYKITGGIVRLADGRVLVAAGAPVAEVFDPVTATFAPVGGTANAEYSFATAVVLPDGSAVVMGGYDDSISLADQVLRFVP